MKRLFLLLLTIFFSLNGLAMGANSEFVKARGNNAMDSLYQGYYLNASIYAFQSVGEIGVFAATLGYSSAATPWLSQSSVAESKIVTVLGSGVDVSAYAGNLVSMC